MITVRQRPHQTLDPHGPKIGDAQIGVTQIGVTQIGVTQIGVTRDRTISGEAHRIQADA